MNDCVFCQKIKEGSVIKVTNRVFRFEPLNPVTDGHMLFVPVEHTTNAVYKPMVTAATVREAIEYMGWLGKASNLIINNGEAASQTIFHLHVHVIPRVAGDGLMLPWSITQERTSKHG